MDGRGLPLSNPLGFKHHPLEGAGTLITVKTYHTNEGKYDHLHRYGYSCCVFPSAWKGRFPSWRFNEGPGSRCEIWKEVYFHQRVSRGSNPFEHDLAIYDCATEDANHSYDFKRTTVCQRGLASRKNGAQLCYDFAKKGQCSRAHRAGSDTSPRDGIRYTEMWRQVSQENDSGIIRLMKFGPVKVVGGWSSRNPGKQIRI